MIPRQIVFWTHPVDNCMFKVNDGSSRTRCEICSKLTITTPERRQPSFWCPECYLWTYFTPCSITSIVNFEQVNAEEVDVAVGSISFTFSSSMTKKYLYALFLKNSEFFFFYQNITTIYVRFPGKIGSLKTTHSIKAGNITL